MGGVFTRLKGLDLYRKVPRDLSEPTLSGAFVSLVSATLMTWLFVSELMAYLKIRVHSEMYIDHRRDDDRLQINLDVSIHRLPCEILSLDAQDVMGSHEVDIHGNLVKTRISKDGAELENMPIQGSQISPRGLSPGAATTIQYHYSPEDLKKIEQMVKDLEGCRIRGFVQVNKVPGNVHISTHSHAHLLASLYGTWQKMDIGHTINHLSFGNDREVEYVRRTFKDTGIVSPLDGSAKTQPEKHDDPVIFEYYCNVVPTIYEGLEGSERHVFQFTANSNQIANPQMPSIYFRYHISPVTVRFQEMREQLITFLTQVCGIVGGVFTVAGLMDAIIHRSMMHLAKSTKLG
ncbi:unnamed protein product [Vitrella brassicaformis CCMP3155]|uniref:Endoplasmic reticulum vesicle transporter C-terminal domain-containing protein n=1 Tax=Vitrella brassicaformis (strain CCMP3155) TaxID=1169540 RepID=A0A0G4G6N4_VITBC|nr:unnamed protein product [Vitrella brassicaformis CCMP3155]|eukprot:CEM24367.1 unnamed protein product [Vitrella brassicaformis CCMP3155]